MTGAESGGERRATALLLYSPRPVRVPLLDHPEVVVPE